MLRRQYRQHPLAPLAPLVGREEHRAGGRAQGQGIGQGGDDRLGPGVQVPLGDEARHVQSQRGLRQGGWEGRQGRLAGEGTQPGPALGLASAAIGRRQVEYPRPAQGAAGGLVAEDATIAVEGGDGSLQDQIRQALLARRQALPLQQAHPGHDMGGAQVQMHGGPVAQGPLLRGQEPHRDREAVGGEIQRRIEDPVAPADVPGVEIMPRQLQGAALARHANRHGPVLGAQAPHPHLAAGGSEQQPVAGPHLPAVEGAGDQGADAGEGETAVDGQPAAAWTVLSHLSHYRGQMVLQGGDALAGEGADREERLAGQRGPGEEGGHLGLSRPPPFRAYPVDFGQGDGPLVQTQQIQDLQVLAGLGHGAIVGGHHQQDEVDPRRPGHHGVDQLFVAGDIDEAQDLARGQGLVGIAQVEGDAAGLLLRQAVGVDAGEGAHQGGLAVVDMAGGPDDHGRAPGSAAPGPPRLIGPVAPPSVTSCTVPANWASAATGGLSARVALVV